ncbi:hypothetical protein [Hymenobacter cellulosilyticus]|uniref:hypothetical protein n=1 Tax=Hymenobacter cellulosilyticus TaxID=2932248 RepID=UPI0028802956|nr:hypothetical protein [Hymenobacter cellulosilyticus]
MEKYGAGLADAALSEEQFKLLVYNLGVHFDSEKGGMNRAPKFPMPSIWRFLLRCYARTGSQLVLNQTLLTLREMAWGGIYDQVGGALRAIRWMPSGWCPISRRCSTTTGSW